MRRLCRAIALAGALTLPLSGCGGDEPPEEERLAYTVAPSAEPPPADAGTDTSVATERRVCVSSDGPGIKAPIPTAWQVETSDIDECKWSTDDATITLTYGETPDNDSAVWKSILGQHQEAELEGGIPGYSITRYAENEGGGPLWHYRYVDSGVEGSVYIDSLNLYRDGWQIAYEAESLDYNRYLADQLIEHAKPS
ncbi:MAG: hypothetical protein L0K86_20675 [Actinomycetia bacterium]|nr:hypothetical protein [Actinomycetes bacterium]